MKIFLAEIGQWIQCVPTAGSAGIGNFLQNIEVVFSIISFSTCDTFTVVSSSLGYSIHISSCTKSTILTISK